jgi:hypothetical protein
MTRIAPAEPPYEPAIADALARIDRRAIAEVTWTALAEHFDAVQILETIALAGYYHAISFLCLGLELPLESYAAFRQYHQPTGVSNVIILPHRYDNFTSPVFYP